MRGGTGQTHLGLFVTKDIRGSVWAVSLRGIPPRSAAWGSQQVRGGHSTVGCPCQAPLPLPVVATQRGQRVPALQQGSCAKQRDLGLMQGPFEVWQFSFCDWKLFLTGCLLFCTCNQFCASFLSEPSAHGQNDWFFPVRFLTWNSSKTHLLASLTFSLPWQ